MLTVAVSYVFMMSRYVIEMNNQYAQQGDLPAYDHVIYMLGKGPAFSSTLCGSVMEFAKTVANVKPYPTVPDNFSSLGIHFIPGLAYTVYPFEVLFPGVNTTLVVQTLAFALTAVLLFGLFLKWNLQPLLAVSLASAYLLHPANLGANVNAFHPVIMALPLLMAMVLAFEARSWVLYFVFLVAAGFIQENVSITLLAMTLLFVIRKEWKLGALNAGLSFAFFVLTTKVGIPHFNMNQTCPYCAIYGSPMGGSMEDIIKNSLFHPTMLVSTLFRPEIRSWVASLMQTIIWLPTLSPTFLLIAAAGVAPSFLTTNHAMHILWGQYNALAIPFLFIGAALGILRIQKWMGEKPVLKRSLVPLGIALFVGLPCYTFKKGESMASFPWSKPSYIFNSNFPSFNPPDLIASIDEITKSVPAEGSLSAPDSMLGKLHRRPKVYFFPVHHVLADYVIVPAKDWYMKPEEIVRLVSEMQVAGYKSVTSNKDFTLYKRPM